MSDYDDGGGGGGSGSDAPKKKKAAKEKKEKNEKPAKAAKAAPAKAAAASSSAAAAASSSAAAGAGAGAGIGAGAPRKITSATEAEAVLLDYLNRTNRPFSALNVRPSCTRGGHAPPAAPARFIPRHLGTPRPFSSLRFHAAPRRARRCTTTCTAR